MERLTSYILAARPQGKVYLLYWRSGSWKVPFAAPIVTAGLRIFRISKMLHPAALAADAAVTIGFHSYQFRKKEKLAETLGLHLPELLAEIPQVDTLPLNLFGHSLGGRVIQSTLKEHDWDTHLLNDCLVMASAGDRDLYAWEEHTKKVRGKFYNAYSASDLTLKISPDLRSRVGRHPIPVESDQIVNVPFPGFKHTDYWPKLPEVLKKTWPHYQPSSHIEW
jgi:pimeloyl-ACP methyl ester carboxylesterase